MKASPREIMDGIIDGTMDKEEIMEAIRHLRPTELAPMWEADFDAEGSVYELTLIAERELFTPEEYSHLMALIRQALTTGEEESDNFEAPVEVAKSDEYKNLVFGWASVAFSEDGTQIVDRQGHAIDIEDLEDAAYNFTINGRGSGDMHKSDSFGELVESMVFTEEKTRLLGLEGASIPQGWWVGFRVPPEYHEQVRVGDRTMFSIEGTAKLEPY